MTYSYALGWLLPKLSLKVAIFSIFLCVEAHARGARFPLAPAALGNPIDTITSLQIGDTIPEALWNLPLQVINHPEGKETITLNDYRGKLIILDFWRLNCSHCIAAFPKLDSLQLQFNNELQIVLATQHEHPKILKFHQRKPIPSRLFSTTADSVLPRIFPHHLVPHYAWINRYGTMVATTNGTPVTAKNIRLALNGQPIQAVQKYDLDSTSPFFLTDTESELPLHYALFRRGHYPGLNSQVKNHVQNGIVRGTSFANYTYRELYHLVARPQFKARGIRLTPNRWILQATDSLNWLNTSVAARLDPGLLYTYELVVPPEEAPMLDSVLLSTLNSYTGCTASIQQVMVPCLVITSASPQSPSVGENHNQLLSQLVMRWNRSYMPEGKPNPILLDESGYTHPLPDNLRAPDVQTLRRVLDSLGLNLTETTRPLDMLVITQH